MHKKRRTARVSIRKLCLAGQRRLRDTLVVEEPLTVLWHALDGPPARLSATMRTPGEDNQLAAGLLFSEGLLRRKAELETLSFCAGGGPNELNRLTASLRLCQQEAERRLAHRPSAALPQSACGLCAFDELSNPRALLKWAASSRPPGAPLLEAGRELLDRALAHLERQAPVFAATGASHAVVLVGPDGQLLAAAEDVGRHNACDKAVGAVLLADRRQEGDFSLAPGTGMLFSSRLSFELAAKAVRAGAAWIASVGAPTQLAVELARACRLPAYGFVSRDRYNAYLA
jgi:FdhD protein